jgi:endonuclease G, mitochondrial
MKIKYAFALILLFALTLAAQTASVELVLGNPSDAKPDIDQPDNYLVVHTGYVLSYNRTRGGANWVAWHLSRVDMGDALRSNAFAPDTTLPRDWWIRPLDYKGSGYDQGHMCPSEDRTKTDASNRETFLMSNMLPQTDRLNRVTWRSLEAFTQKSVKTGGQEAYIYAGCYGDKGRIKDKITVPTNCYKIVVLLAEGRNDRRRINRDTTIIAVDMPNDKEIKNSWKSYVVTVDDLEQTTGYDFLSPLADDVEAALESRK